MSENGSQDGSRSSESFFRHRNKREVFEEQGIQMWSFRHTCLLALVVAIMVLGLGSAGARASGAVARKDAKEHTVLTTPFPSTDAKNFDSMFRLIGCYPLLNGDSIVNPDLMDYTCMPRGAMGIPCRSGLPFYRMSYDSMAGRAPVSWRMCAAYCLFKGFDVSGVVSSVECRCGATQENMAIWKKKNVTVDRLELLWQPPWNEVPSNSSQCQILAARFTGEVPMTGITFDRTTQDLQYVQSIVNGAQVHVNDDVLPVGGGPRARVELSDGAAGAGGPPGVPELQQKWLESAPAGRNGSSQRSCYPADCASGLTWPIYTDFSGTGIPIAFSDSVPPDTKRVFLEAMRALNQMTCIRFTEVSVFYNRTYKIRVRGDQEGCFTKFLGYPAGSQSRGDAEINLGWCKSELEQGAMLHELCHALGMGHEQTRPDRDMYVQVRWETMMNPTDRAQYAVDQRAYTGSAVFGPAPYDYESIMHYPASENMITKPTTGRRGAHDSQIGQRQHLSPGDVTQLRNMYRCDARSIECVDNDEGLDRFGPYVLPGGAPVTCAYIKAHSMCSDPTFGQDIRYFCANSCGVCPQKTAQELVPMHGCEDRTGMEALCELYKNYCPGKVPGHEQYMYENCRRTCWIEQFCGTTTTVRQTTTTARPTAPNARHLSLTLDFDIAEGTYDLNRREDRIVLQENLQARAQNAFNTFARVEIDPFSSTSATSQVNLACDCDPALQLRCSISCRDLESRMRAFAADRSVILNEKMQSDGLAGLHVTSSNIMSADGIVRSVLSSRWTMLGTAMIGGIGLAATCAIAYYYYWMHTPHKSQREDAQYTELSEGDPEQ